MDARKQALLNRLSGQLTWLQSVSTRLNQLDQRFFWYRLATFGGAWVAALLARFLLPGNWWLAAFLLFIFAFLVVVFFHRRLDDQRQRYQSMCETIASQVARLQLNWAEVAMPEMPQVDRTHHFAHDLDLIGARSLIHLLDQTRSRGGQSRLADWLLDPQLDSNLLHMRQKQVQQLSGLPGFRRAYLSLSPARIRWDQQPLLAWLSSNPPGSRFQRWLLLLAGISLLNLVLLLLNLFGFIPPYWQFGLVVYAGLYLVKHQSFKELFQDAYTLNQSLTKIRAVFRLLETYPFPPASDLNRVVANLRQPAGRPSTLLRKIEQVTSAASLQNNQILWLLVNLLVPWDLYFARLLNSYKAELVDLLPAWLSGWYELDALLSLAQYSANHPEDCFPQVAEYQAGRPFPLLKATALGHPLLDPERKVRNDWEISQPGQIALVSGSNMSGKSTFLRTVGINLVLAFAGAPVNATSMQVVCMRLYTSIQVLDSLSDGFSYFYAEVRRLKTLLSLLEDTQSAPLFYLIDEIFRGTNNEERRTGSQAYIRALAGAYGSGIISTHDLALTRLSETNPNIHNVHFRDDVIAGKMSFDYRLHEGPSPSTNALKIMKIEGLPVDPMV